MTVPSKSRSGEGADSLRQQHDPNEIVLPPNGQTNFRMNSQLPMTNVGNAPGEPSKQIVVNSPSNPLRDSRSTALWLRRTDRIVVSTMLLALMTLLSIHWMRLSRWGSVPIEVVGQQPREYYYSLDINTASWVEWAQLAGIGETLAKRIVADRDEHGLFRDAHDVIRVRGIHQKQFETMLPFLRGGSEPEVHEP